MSVKRIQSVRLESGEESWNLENPGLKHGQDSAKGPPPDTSEDGCDPQPTERSVASCSRSWSSAVPWLCDVTEERRMESWVRLQLLPVLSPLGFGNFGVRGGELSERRVPAQSPLWPPQPLPAFMKRN